MAVGCFRQDGRSMRYPCQTGGWIVALILVAVISGTSLAQFVVQPMKLELTLRAGSVYRRYEGAELSLENRARTQTEYVRLYVVDLAQGEDGSWLPLDPNNPDQLAAADLAQLSHYSCKEWLIIGKGTDTPVAVNPLRVEKVPVTIMVPPGVRGFYCAAVVAALQPRTDVTGVEVVYQFVVPVLIRIEDSTAYPKVQLTDLGLEVRQAQEGMQGSTYVMVSVENTGATYSHIVPKAQLLVYAGDSQRVVVRDVEFKPAEYDIIPGARFKLRADIGRALPAGKYLVRGGLYVDGKRARSLSKDIEFAGDPSIKRLAADAAITTYPSSIMIEARPGGMKTTVVEIRNGSPEPVAVRAYVRTPTELSNKVGAGKRGDDLSCAQWVEVSPAEFTLTGYGARNVRLLCRMPSQAVEYKGYYADLALYANYADGTNAGTSKALICVMNQTAQSNLYVVCPQPIRFEPSDQPSRYNVFARFANIGDRHVDPRCEIQLIRPDQTTAKTGRMTSQAQDRLLLPLEQRDFAGELDLTYIPEGTYLLRVALRDAVANPQPQDLAEGYRYVQVYLDQNNRRLMEEIPENTFKQEASKVQKTVKWGGQ